MFDARIIANFILDRADEQGRQVTNLDLQKLLYFVHGHYLVRFRKSLVFDEFEAWTYGPVHRTVYDAFKHYDDTPIDSHASAYDPIRRQRRALPDLTDESVIEVMDSVLVRYLDMPTYLLVQLTHAEGTPWSLTVSAAERRPNVGMKIPNQLIEDCFEGSSGALAVGD